MYRYRPSGGAEFVTENPHDPRGLIAEAFRMEELTPAECRTIFLDWAISVPQDDLTQSASYLLEFYSQTNSAHPMLEVLAEVERPASKPKRRSKRRS